jgi:molecular chaperone GrpE
VLRDFSVTPYNPLGDAFDPNLHDAVYEVPDPSREPGTVAVVEKTGYMLHDRVLRPAQVGVTRKG